MQRRTIGDLKAAGFYDSFWAVGTDSLRFRDQSTHFAEQAIFCALGRSRFFSSKVTASSFRWISAKPSLGMGG
jgi:hypothetical protein